MAAFDARFFNEIGKDVCLEMIDFNHWDAIGNGKSFGKRSADEQGAK